MERMCQGTFSLDQQQSFVTELERQKMAEVHSKGALGKFYKISLMNSDGPSVAAIFSYVLVYLSFLRFNCDEILL